MNNAVALVTGAKKGIGLGSAIKLAESGFSIALNDMENDQELENSLKKVSTLGTPCIAAPFDVSDIDCHEAWLNKIDQVLGTVTTLVNNAGVSVFNRGDLLDVSEASWDRCHTINAKAMFFLSQKFARYLLGKPRDQNTFYSIINVTSANAEAVAEYRTEYCASKAAAAMVSKSLSVRLGRENIHVYDVRPGLIDTDMTASVIKDYSRRAKDGLTLLPRISTPAEMGEIIANLACGKLPYVTGQAIAADGGLLIPRF
ncbi:MAG: 3-ketoacyl-ACP reductase [Rhodobacteraceae bacterium]|nr:3-ketoacyl-ACP reductase [Paracoccaceae bacterium]